MIPSSLFGGRLFTGYKIVHKKKLNQKVFKKMVSDVGGTLPQEPAFNNNEGNQSFPDHKPKAKGSGRRSNQGGGNKAGTGAKGQVKQGANTTKAKTQRQRQQNLKGQGADPSSSSNQPPRRRRRGGRSKSKSNQSKPKDSA